MADALKPVWKDPSDCLWKDPSEDAGSPSTAHASRKRKGEMLENVGGRTSRVQGGALYPLQLRTLRTAFRCQACGWM